MVKKKTTKKQASTNLHERHLLDRITNKATIWVGSTASIILHTLFFVIIFVLVMFGVSLDTVLLVLTTVVSLEAIYLAIFIQRSVNLQTQTLVEEFDDLEEAISEDIDETEAALMKDLDDTEKNISDDLDETHEAIISNLDEEEETSIGADPETVTAIAKELRKIVREEVQRALRNK